MFKYNNTIKNKDNVLFLASKGAIYEHRKNRRTTLLNLEEKNISHQLFEAFLIIERSNKMRK